MSQRSLLFLALVIFALSANCQSISRVFYMRLPDARSASHFERNKNSLEPEQAGYLEACLVDLNSFSYSVKKVPDGEIFAFGATAKGSRGLSLYFSDLKLTGESHLNIYDGSGSLIQTITSADLNDSPLFATADVDDDSLMVELFVSNGSKVVAKIESVGVLFSSVSRDFGHAGTCEVPINCVEGSNWQTLKKGVVRIRLVRGGMMYWCTGSLINNTAQNNTPYILTADHCGNGTSRSELLQWVFSFNYESVDCSRPSIEPLKQTMTGATKVASSHVGSSIGSDFYLVRLKNSVPASMNGYFLGWNRTNTATGSGVSIHHPQGDIKMISTYTQTPINSGWDATVNTHWQVYWAGTSSGHGVTEGGSSGSPLLNTDGHIIGVLTGGDSGCNYQDLADYYGKFSYGWDQNGIADTLRLKPWLDPLNTGATILGGMVVGVENILNQQVTLYPNPASQEIVVSFPFGNGLAQWELFNMTGQQMATGTFIDASTKIAVNRFAKGLYVLRIKRGNESGTSTFVVN